MIVALLFLSSLVNAYSTFPRYYGEALSDNFSASCLPIFVADGQKGKMTITLRSISMNETTSAIPDVPVFMSGLIEHEKLRNIVNRYNFENMDDLFDKVDINDLAYANSVEVYDGFLQSSLWNTNRKSIVSSSLEVSHSGLYCAWITPEVSVVKVGIDTEVTNSYGYLPLPVYTENTQLGYYILITSIVVSASLYSLLVSNTMNNMIAVYYFSGVMLPTFATSIVRYSFNLFANRKPLYESGTDPTFIQLLTHLESIIDILNKVIFLLLAMGFGSIYRNDTTSAVPGYPGREMPTRLTKRASLLRDYNLVFNSLNLELADDLFEVVIDPYQLSGVRLITSFINFVCTAFPLLWMSLGLIYYIRTFRKIQRSKATNITTFSKVISFKISILIIFLIPVIAGATSLILVINKINASGKTFEEPWKKETYDVITQVNKDEMSYFSQELSIKLLWVRHLSSIFTMYLFYFLWILESISSNETEKTLKRSNLDSKLG